MIIVILGPQGSGKGTQAELLAKEFNLFYFDMGSYLRNEAKKNQMLDNFVNKEGQFVPEDISMPLAEGYLSAQVPDRDNIIFDGLPRSFRQAQMLNEWLKAGGKKVDNVVFLDIPEKVSIQRLSARRICKVCGKVYNLITNLPEKDGKCSCGGDLAQREDDQPEAIKQRLSWYKKLIQPVLDYYQEEGLLIRVNGELPISDIFKEIVSKIRQNI
jgi:adenylate kinase